MKRKITRTLSVLLALLLLLTALPTSAGLFTASAEEETYAVGDLIEYGSYPQTRVKDTDLLTALNAALTLSDNMQYADMRYGWERYRAVRFTQYPDNIMGVNGYEPGEVYWFKYEPIKWRVLDPVTGLVLCETIIDNLPYSDYDNDYVTSAIRTWLNDDFLNTAFSSAEQAGIYTTKLDNAAYPGYPQYDSAATNDKIFLLSYYEVLNPAYGFSANDTDRDPARQASGSDYAEVQGLWVAGYAFWFLRSPGYNSHIVCHVHRNGSSRMNCHTYSANVGCRPALRLNLDSIIPVTGVAVEPTGMTLTVGDTQQLTATVEPQNALNQAVAYTSDNEAVATVDENGLVTAVAPGTAAITVRTADGGFTDTCVVTVTEAQKPPAEPTYLIIALLNALRTIFNTLRRLLLF